MASAWVNVMTMRPATGGTMTVDYNYLSDPQTTADGGTLTTQQQTVTQVRWTNTTSGVLVIQPRQRDATIKSPQTVVSGNSGTFTFPTALGGVNGVALSVRWPA